VAIAYPPVDGKVAIAHNGLAYNGFYAVRADTTIQPSWYARGAMPAVFKSIEWSQDFIGVPRTMVSNEVAFPVTDAIPDGTSTFLHLTFVDPWKRQKFADEAIVVSTSIHTAVLSTIL
jgi:hypothetical protein